MEIDLFNVKFKCPHCGFVNEWHSHTLKSYSKTELYSCSDEQGGCGTQIVVKTVLKIGYDIQAHKIEGIEPPKELLEGFCDCEDYESGLVSNFCPVHNDNPLSKENELN